MAEAEEGAADVDANDGSAEVTAVEANEESVDIGLTLDNLFPHRMSLVSVSPSATFEEAITAMQINDYSQLGVLATPHTLHGSVSWESIAAAKHRDPDASFSDAIDQRARDRVFDYDTRLLDVLGTLQQHGFIFVRDDQGKISGIVTAADVVRKYDETATPFFLIGEIDQELRQLIQNTFDEETVRQHRAVERAAEGAQQRHALQPGPRQTQRGGEAPQLPQPDPQVQRAINSVTPLVIPEGGAVMSALTHEVKDPRSPVAQWLRATFPHHRDVQAAYRDAVGPARVLPSAAVATGTQGTAIDWWLRMLVDPAPSVGLAFAGLRSRRSPCVRAGMELLLELGAIEREGHRPRAVDPSRFADRSDEWWARVCYALALLVELYRAPLVDGSRLMRLYPHSSAADLLALANSDEVADLIAMRDLAREQLLPALPNGPVATGSTFDGSADLNADADLIVDGVLVDFKSSQGGRPRADGTRAAKLERVDLDQLLGYVLLDYSDTFALHSVAIYAVCFGQYTAWPLTELCTQLAGRPVDIPALRKEFAQVVRTELSAYRRTAIAARMRQSALNA